MSVISAAQQAANAATAQLSHGPATPEGKRRSSFNALRHGLTGRVVLLPEEDLNQYQAFSDRFREDLKPKGELETQIAQTIIDTQWRLHRIRAIEDGLFALGAMGAPAVSAAGAVADHPEINSALGAATAFQEKAQAFNNLSLYEQRLHRMLEKSLAQLKNLQRERQAREEVALDRALVLYQTAKKEGKSFNPRENGFDFSKEDLEAQSGNRKRLEEAVWTVNRSLLPPKPHLRGI